MQFEKFTLLHISVGNMHGNGHDYLAVPPPRVYTYYLVWCSCSSPTTVSPDSEITVIEKR